MLKLGMEFIRCVVLVEVIIYEIGVVGFLDVIVS